jgi:hypothetical protein
VAARFWAAEAGDALSGLSLAKMLSGANAFEISDIQEDEAEAGLTRRSGCNVALGRKWPDGVFGKHSLSEHRRSIARA